MGAEHNINGHIVRWMFSDKILIIGPCGKELWTNSFEIVRQETKKQQQYELNL